MSRGATLGSRGLLLVLALTAAHCALPATTPGGATAQHYEGVPAGYTHSGPPYRGSPDAPVVLEEWSDYQCPFCARHFRQTLPDLLNDEVRAGRVRIEFHDFPLDGLHPRAAFGHIAARCAGEQGAPAYWAMHDL